jgi:RNA polymerase sigma-54 factor
MKASLQLKFSQQLALTPQLQQSIKLLQLSTVELNQELEKFLLENPLLERDETEARLGDETGAFSALNLDTNTTTKSDAPEANEMLPTQVESNDNAEKDFSFENGDFSDFGEGATNNRLSGASDDDERNDRDAFASTADSAMSLQQYLLDQLPLTSLSTRDRQVAAFIIANLDDDGYLTIEMQDLADMLIEHMAEAMLEEDMDAEDVRAELNIALQHVQHLDPVGVGARSLSECLRLQLDALPTDTPFLSPAIKLVTAHLDVLAQRDLLKLKRLLQVNEEELKAIRALVVTLEPKPGRRFSQGDTRYIVPDVLVKKVRGRWRAMLNQDAMPKLRVNKMYADLVHRSRDAEGKNLSGQLQEARWLVKNIQQRFETILKVTEAIVENQRHFFDHGEVAMRPLVLREIADLVGLHESTISRVTTQKYMLTPRGIFELKYFFGASVATETGGACSATAIRALIKQLVEGEDQRKPLSDNKIADILSAQGILVARRTVAKYRESLQIGPANLRKSF